MEQRVYQIRRELSLVLAAVESARQNGQDDAVVTALDAMQDAISRVVDLVEELSDAAHHPGRYVRRGRMRRSE